MHDRLVNEVPMGESFVQFIGWPFASADGFRRSLREHRFRTSFASAFIKSALPALKSNFEF
jgi:hypothetical protein